MSKLQQQWEDCKKNQPDLIPKLAELAFELQRRGHSKYSISGLFHILRWETSATTGDLGLKVNNNHQPFAARELMIKYPQLIGFLKHECKNRKALGAKYFSVTLLNIGVVNRLISCYDLGKPRGTTPLLK